MCLRLSHSGVFHVVNHTAQEWPEGQGFTAMPVLGQAAAVQTQRRTAATPHMRVVACYTSRHHDPRCNPCGWTEGVNSTP